MAYRFNRILIFAIACAPILGCFLVLFLNMDFYKTMQILSFLGVFLLLIFKDKSTPFIFPKYLFFYLLFILYNFYSAFVLLDRDFSIKYIYSNGLIGAFNFMLIVENVPISKEYFKRLISVCKFILILSFVVILIQEQFDPTFFVSNKFRRLDLIEDVDSHSNRLLSIYSWIGELSEVGFSFVPLFILLVEYLHRKKINVLIWIIIGVLFAIFSKARWIMVNTILVFALFINYRTKIKDLLKYVILIPVFVTSFLIISSAVGLDIKGVIMKRVLESDKKNLNQKSASTRLLAFEAFNKLYWNNAVWGKGSIKYGMGGTGEQDYELKKFLRRRSSQIHVGYLSLLYMYGIVGGGFFFVFLYYLMRKMLKSAKATGLWGPFLGFLGFVLANFTLVYFSLYQMGFIIAMVVNKYYCDNLLIKNELKNV